MPGETGTNTTKSAAAFDDVATEPGSAKPDPVLVADGVHRHFGGVVAVDVDHVEFQRQSITALIGPNGAGKTTFFNLMTAFDQPQSGNWSLNGDDLRGVKPYRMASRGMVRTFQLTKSLAKMTVIENMRLGAKDQIGERWWMGLVWPAWRGQERQITFRAEELLERFNLAHMRDEYAGSLSGGQRKLLEMARALMTEPSLIMLDEPMAGVNPALKQVLNAHIKTLRDEGLTVLFVEHDMDMVHDISDWVVVMAEGRIIAEGRPDDIAANPAVIDAYLGAHQGESLLEGEIDDGFGEALDAGLTLEGARVDEDGAFIFADRKDEIRTEKHEAGESQTTTDDQNQDRTHD